MSIALALQKCNYRPRSAWETQFSIYICRATIIINMNTFQITYNLDQLYPDIQGELCSKHTIALNQLHKAYNKTYNTHTPSHYVVVNRAVHLLRGTHLQLSMAMEQGVALILSSDSQNSKLNISSNLFSEVIIEKTGKIINAEHEPQFSEIASSAVELGVDDLSLNKIKGGHIYIRFQQGETISTSRQPLLIAFFMAIIVINGLLEQYDQAELISKLKSLPQFQHNHLLEHYFNHYSNRSLLVSHHQQAKSIKLDNKIKMVFMKLDFLDEGGQYEQVNLNSAQIDQAIGELQEGVIDLSALMGKVSNIQKKLIKHQQILEFVQNIVNIYKIKGFLFVDRYCIFLVESYRYAEVIGKVSRLIHQKLASQLENQQSSGLENRHHSSQISSLLFSSAPSGGLAVLDPCNSLWF